MTVVADDSGKIWELAFGVMILAGLRWICGGMEMEMMSLELRKEPFTKKVECLDVAR